jgi:signal transduction histidine kinase
MSTAAARWLGITDMTRFVGFDLRARVPVPSQAFEAIALTLSEQRPSHGAFPSVFRPDRWIEFQTFPTKTGVLVRFRPAMGSQPVVGEASRRRKTAPPEPAQDIQWPAPDSQPKEIALIDSRGIIVSVNKAWRAACAAHGVTLADDGVGARYVDVAKAAVADLDKALLQKALGDLLSGASAELEATYRASLAGELRRVQITPVTVKGSTHLLAIHEDVTPQAKVEAALRETAEQLLSAQDDERRRIALELHDTGQLLAGLVLGLGRLRRRMAHDNGARAMIDELTGLARQADEEMRVLSYLMNAASGPPGGLAAAIASLVEGFSRRTGLKSTFDAKGPVDGVSAAVQHAAFRVIQEALTNVYRHARATRVSVRLASQAGRLTMRITDDGLGIPRSIVEDPDTAPLGVGIPGMRVRIQQLGGTLEIDGRTRGTQVRATIPLSAGDSPH